jgi:glycerophosphoryl diester phosphodiesterase
MRYAFAHRGGRGHGPDNVLPTFTEALVRGASGLETDAWVTADGIVVLDHDGVHQRGRNEVPITEVPRNELLAHIPSLADLYATCGTDFDLAIDVKGKDAENAILDVAQAHGAANRLWLFTPTTMRPGRVRPAHGGATLRRDQLRNKKLRRAVLLQLMAQGTEVVNARWPLWRRSAIDDVHGLGMLAFAWDVQSSIALRRCEVIGIDGIFSDHIDLLHEARADIRS